MSNIFGGMINQLNGEIFRPDPLKVHAYYLAVNKVWYQGEPAILQRFYKQEEHIINPFIGLAGNPNLGYHWKMVTGKYHKTHSGVPRLIVDRMRDLVNTGFEFNIVDPNGENIEELEVKLQEILKENNFEEKLFDQGITTESWAGFAVYKLAADMEISDNPIIEMVDPEKISLNMSRGRIKEVIINFTVGDDDEKFYIEEVYSRNKEGFAQITYNCFKDKDKKESCQLAEFKPHVFKTLRQIPIYIKNNTTVNSNTGSPFGESDFTNLHSLFDDADEKLSQLSHKIRHANPKRFISEDLLNTNANGDVSNFNDYETDYIISNGDLDDEAARSLLQQHTMQIEAEEYLKSYQAIVSQIVSNAGLSPITLGDFTTSGLTDSGDTLREREKLSQRTRDGKLKLWKPFLEKMFTELLQFAAEFEENELPEFEVIITFNPFEEQTFEQKVSSLGEAKMNGLITQREALEIMNPDDTPLEIDTKLRIIKSEQQLPVFAEELSEPTNEEANE